MSILEILLLAAGALLITASFFIKTNDDVYTDISGLVKDEVKKSIEEESENMRKHVEDVVDEAVTYAEEKTERTLERISNEKIMAVNEYSDTVLEEINKNHKEVMFLYDMLNDKQTNLNETVKACEEAQDKAAKTADDLVRKTEQMQKIVDDLAAQKVPVRKAQTPAPAIVAPAAQPAPAVAEKPAPKKEEEPEIPFEDISEPVKHTSQKARSFFSELALDEAIATVQSVPAEKNEKAVRTLNWAELAVSDANEAEKKEAAKEGREPESKIEGPQEKLNREVIELSESGMSDVEIAKQLKMGVGEVSLILGLHNK